MYCFLDITRIHYLQFVLKNAYLKKLNRISLKTITRAWRKKVVTQRFFQCIIILNISCKNISCIFLSLTEKMYIAIRLYFK